MVGTIMKGIGLCLHCFVHFLSVMNYFVPLVDLIDLPELLHPLKVQCLHMSLYSQSCQVQDFAK